MLNVSYISTKEKLASTFFDGSNSFKLFCISSSRDLSVKVFCILANGLREEDLNCCHDKPRPSGGYDF